MIAQAVSHLGPIVDCDENGEAKVVISVVSKDKDIAFTHDLFDTSIPPQPLPHHAVQSHNGQSNQITFIARTPKPGNYALALYSNVDDTSSSGFSPFCYYLVTSKKQKAENSKFPPIPNKTVGFLQPFMDLSLNVKSCYPSDKCDLKNGILGTDDEGECCIVLSHSQLLTVIVELSDDQSVFNEHTCIETTGTLTSITVRPPASHLGMAYCLKIYAAELDQSKNLPSVFVGLIFSHVKQNDIPPFPQCPLKTWGPAGPTFVKNGVKRVRYRNSKAALRSKYDNPELDLYAPRRIYSGGDDFILELEMTEPLQLKVKVHDVEGGGDDSVNQSVLLEKPNISSAAVRVRFANPGTFSLVAYGSSQSDQSGQLSPLVYTLVHVTSPSSNTQPFPVVYGIWGSSACQLYYPLSQNLSKEEEVSIKIFLGQFQKQASEWSIVPYPEVMAVADGSRPVDLEVSSENMFEWKYFPGLGEQILGILVKPQENSDSMTYALQFKIV